MRTWAKGSAGAAFLAAGVMALGGGTAYADTGGAGSIGGGNQVNLPITLPVDISGNAVAVGGKSVASSRGGASVEGIAGSGRNQTSGKHSILGGNQVVAPITAPVNVCGNAVSLFGRSDAACKGGSAVKGSRRGGAGGNTTSGVHSILGGNQVVAPITAPVDVCGTAVAVLGGAKAGCQGGASVRDSAVRSGGNRTSGKHSILGGNQVVAPITAPVNVCGTSIAALGEAFSGCQGGASAGGGHHHRPRPGGHGGKHGGWSHKGHGGSGGGHGHYRPGSTGHDHDGRYAPGSGSLVIPPVKKVTPRPSAGGNRTSGTSSIAGGNQVVAPITVPINICGNAVAIAGDAFSGCRGGATVTGRWGKGDHAGGNVTSGRSSILGGNQVVAPITAPINICGNAVAVLGRAKAGCQGGASVPGGVGGGGNITSGRYGILAGNQVVAPITAPINVCGNSVAVLGDAGAGCLGGAKVGSRGWKHYGGHWDRVRATGLMPATPALPMLSDLKQASGLPQHVSAAAAPAGPVVGDLPSMLGLPEKPSVPVVSEKPVSSGKARGAADLVSEATEVLPRNGSLNQVPKGLPVEKTIKSVTGGLEKALPLSNLSLMSAEQPAGVTGMNPTSFAVLVLGAMFAASAILFAFARRFRFGRR